ncbi:hypothetical protein EDB19DRAFT_1836448 [Suillus lakei]|nr:hypothetical protein EDB19DRAFT_1836448 [Suillus lakei]
MEPSTPISFRYSDLPAELAFLVYTFAAQADLAERDTTPLGRPVKQEPISARRSASQPQATQESEPASELAHTKLVISIQHKPSAQHAQFSMKPHTQIGKVLTAACKRFRLDVNVAQLYLVVVKQNDQGLKEEDYLLCDRNETVETAVVGVEGRAEFMIRMPEDPAL